MSIQIIVLNTNTIADGSFAVTGVFWLVAPSNNIVQQPNFQSQVPYVDTTNTGLLQSGALVEQPFNSGLFASGTVLADVQTALQAMYSTAQTNLTSSSSSPIGTFVGNVFDGTSWWSSNPFLPSPKTQVTLPNLLPPNFQLFFPGSGDDSVHGIGKGTLFQSSSNDDGYGPTSHSVNWQFNDWVTLHGGHIVYQGAMIGDTVNYIVYAPATAVTGVGGTGNVSLVSGVVIVPGVSTNYNVNLSTAVPVPSPTNTGYWNWTPATNNLSAGTITPNLNGTGQYNMYAVQITLGEFVVNYPLLGSNYIDLTVPAILPKKVLPQWVHQVTVNNSGHDGLQIVWALTVSRAITVGM